MSYENIYLLSSLFTVHRVHTYLSPPFPEIEVGREGEGGATLEGYCLCERKYYMKETYTSRMTPLKTEPKPRIAVETREKKSKQAPWLISRTTA